MGTHFNFPVLTFHEYRERRLKQLSVDSSSSKRPRRERLGKCRGPLSLCVLLRVCEMIISNHAQYCCDDQPIVGMGKCDTGHHSDETYFPSHPSLRYMNKLIVSDKLASLALPSTALGEVHPHAHLKSSHKPPRPPRNILCALGSLCGLCCVMTR